MATASDFDIVDEGAPGAGHNSENLSELDIALENCAAAAEPLIKARDAALAKSIKDWRERTVISSEAEAESATEFVKAVADHGKEFEKLRRDKKGYYDKIVTAVQAKCKGYTVEMESAAERVRGLLTAFLAAERKKAEEAKAREEAEAEKAALAAKEKGEEPPPREVVRVSVPVGKLKTSSGTNSSVKKVWKWRLKNIKEVPVEYLTVNENTLNAICRGTKQDVNPVPIAGIEFYTEDQLRVS